MKSNWSYLIRIEVWLRLAQPEQERFGIPAERLSGGQKIRATDVQTDPLGGSVVEGLYRSRSVVVAADLAVSLGHPALGVPLKCGVTNRRRRETPLTLVFIFKSRRWKPRAVLLWATSRPTLTSSFWDSKTNHFFRIDSFEVIRPKRF